MVESSQSLLRVCGVERLVVMFFSVPWTHSPSRIVVLGLLRILEIVPTTSSRLITPFVSRVPSGLVASVMTVAPSGSCIVSFVVAPLDSKPPSMLMTPIIIDSLMTPLRWLWVVSAHSW